ncbi:conserved hypothethical protein (plasmid) [Ralstonia solanacearum PSI07]|uniref:Conserved hypothethical protein n=1 Tax=blood disease bacterium R229 TaxID=741978 RepID=G2ZSW4_9RALS|nr:conserved hypothethical protein [Ralstonia solanacearum PSI07]CCA82127.1 conserved hypothethical protein [blood disease bacterium R229]
MDLGGLGSSIRAPRLRGGPTLLVGYRAVTVRFLTIRTMT